MGVVKEGRRALILMMCFVRENQVVYRNPSPIYPQNLQVAIILKRNVHNFRLGIFKMQIKIRDLWISTPSGKCSPSFVVDNQGLWITETESERFFHNSSTNCV